VEDIAVDQPVARDDLPSALGRVLRRFHAIWGLLRLRRQLGHARSKRVRFATGSRCGREDSWRLGGHVEGDIAVRVLSENSILAKG